MPENQSAELPLAEVQDGFVDLWVCPVVPDIIQVIIEIHQRLVGFAVQERCGDSLRFSPIFAKITM